MFPTTSWPPSYCSPPHTNQAWWLPYCFPQMCSILQPHSVQVVFPHPGTIFLHTVTWLAPSPPQIFAQMVPLQWWLPQVYYLELQSLSSSWLSFVLFSALFSQQDLSISDTQYLYYLFALSLPIKICCWYVWGR